ncbi:MAG TPA: hypothetical protein PLU71_00865 [Candidatus Dependentiae bacterium]|nr:hypothetical protein [Candidatus Dependentiae bacterium]HRQ62385.1 hypothetical protein [Candidatus Dependentiae bacterium]
MPKDFDILCEKLVIWEFLAEKGLYQSATLIYPDPPDCEFKSGDKSGWIEVTKAIYRKFNRKKSILSGNKQENNNQLWYDFTETDLEYYEQSKQKIVESIMKKDNNSVYDSSIEKYGKGDLLLQVDDFYFYPKINLENITNPDHYKHLELKRFKRVYLWTSSSSPYRLVGVRVILTPEILMGYKKFFLLIGEE